MNPLHPNDLPGVASAPPALPRGQGMSGSVDQSLATETPHISAQLTELEWWKKQCMELQQHGRETEERFQSVLGENQKLRDERQATAGFGRSEALEAEGTKAPNSAHNSSSDEDIRSLVDKINNLLEDLASRTAALATTQVEAPCKHDPSQAHGRLKDLVGSVFTDALYRSSQQDDFAAVLLQIAWQTIILSQVHDILEHFSATCFLGGEAEAYDDHLIKALAVAIESQQNQTTYGRWRSLTHCTLRLRVSEAEDLKRVEKFVTDTITKCYGAALVLLKRDCLPWQTFWDKFQPQVLEVVQCTIKLATAIKEEVVTKNFVPYFPRRREAFDKDTMEADEGEGTPNDTVACTTRLGLHFTYKPTKESTAVAKKVFTKAQVVTSRALKEMSTPSHRSLASRGGQEDSPTTERGLFGSVMSKGKDYLHSIGKCYCFVVFSENGRGRHRNSASDAYVNNESYTFSPGPFHQPSNEIRNNVFRYKL